MGYKSSYDTFYVLKELNSKGEYKCRIVFPDYEDRHKSNFNPLEWVCNAVARHRAFADCSDEEIGFICAEGREIEYAGWQPDMVFEFYDVMTHKTVYAVQHMEWEH